MTEYACGELEVWRRLVQEVMGMQEKDKVTLKGNMGIKESCFFLIVKMACTANSNLIKASINSAIFISYLLDK